VIDNLIDRRRGLRTLAALAVAVIFGAIPLAEAHRSHVTLTRVAINERSGKWEIVHAIHYHDALRLLATIGVRDNVQPSSIEGRARIALEIEKTFRWSTSDGRPLIPIAVGAELEGDNLLVYQEMTSPAAGARIVVESSFMHNVFADQSNQVLLEYTEPRVTLRLSKSSRRAEFSGPPAARDGG
jgi:hypothetical protein